MTGSERALAVRLQSLDFDVVSTPVGAWFITVLGALTVEGDAGCPDPKVVEQRLASVPRNHRASLSSTGPLSVELVLLDEHGARLAARVLTASTCQGLLEATVASLLAWEASLPAAVPSLIPRTPLSGGPVEPQPPVPPEPIPEGVSGRFDGSVGVQFSGNSITASAEAAALVGPRAAVWKIRFHLVGDWPYSVNVAPGRFRLSRPALGVGGVLGLNEGKFHVEVGASLQAGVVVAWGEGFEQNQQATRFDPGGELSLRLARSLVARSAVFVQAALTVGFVQHTLQVAGIDVVFTVPAVSVGLRVGFSFGS